MLRKRPLSTHSRKQVIPTDTAPAYSVGYGKPPRHTRFQLGLSGNPKGRPKHRRNVATILNDALGQRITIREGNRTRVVTKLDGIILTIVNAALKGDAKAQSSLLRSPGMIREAEQNREPPWNLQALTDDELEEFERLILKIYGKDYQR